jgi:hypothetical protein
MLREMSRSKAPRLIAVVSLAFLYSAMPLGATAQASRKTCHGHARRVVHGKRGNDIICGGGERR